MKNVFLRKANLCWALVFVLALGLFATPTALADDLYGRIRGTITDPTGAVIAGAQLTATNTATGLKRAETTGADGTFEFLNLPPGTYNLQVKKDGFRTFLAANINVVQTQTFVQNIKMQIGAASETVDVEAAAVQVESTSIQLGNTISSNTIVDLPLNGRSWIELQQTLPGVSQADRFTNNYATNGSQSQQNSFLVNGADTNDLPINTPLVQPNADAIAEVQMITNTINPEYGRNSGAIMSATTKTGTNKFHGTGFDFYRDTGLNTKPYFGTAPQAYHRHQYGGTFGGPVKKDKAFFFFGYQGQKYRQPQQTSFSQTVFSDAQRNGDFSAAWAGGCPLAGNSPIALKDESGVTQPAGTPYCTLFPTGHVPTSDFNSISSGLMKYMPKANSGAQNFQYGPTTKGNYNEYLGRYDMNLTKNDQVWAYYLRRGTAVVDDLPFNGGTVPGFGDQNLSHVTQATAAWTHIFNSETLNEVRLGYSRLNYASTYPQNLVEPSSLGFTGITPSSPIGASVPFIGISGMASLGFSYNGPQPRKDQTYQVTDNFSKTIGKHTMKMGWDMRRFQVWNPYLNSNNGYFSFNGTGQYGLFANSANSDAIKSANPGLQGLQFLLGIPDSYSQNAAGFTDARAREFYSYFQDQWKIRQNLTITYGSGWQIDTPIYNKQFGGIAIDCFRPGVQSQVFPTAPAGLVFPGDWGCNNAGGVTTKYGHFAPRAGFAYSPDLGVISGGPGKMSIRGGFGIYFNRFEEETSLQAQSAIPFSAGYSGAAGAVLPDGSGGYNIGSPSFANPWADIAGRPGLSVNNPFPYNPPKAGSNVDFGPLMNNPYINSFDPNMTVPYAMNYNLTVQREFPSRVIVTAAYVGSVGRKLLTWLDGNPNLQPAKCGQIHQQWLNYMNNVPGATYVPDCGASNMGYNYPEFFKYDTTMFSGIGIQGTGANSNYNSFQLTVEKAHTHGLSFRAAYTYAHSLDTNSSFEGNAFTAHANMPNDLARDYGNSDFDTRHRLVLTYNYDLPNLHKTFAMLPNRAFGGWRIGGITTLQTGLPFSVYTQSDRYLGWWNNSFFSFGQYPNWNGVFTTYDPHNSATGPGGNPNTKNYYFNTASFSSQAYGTLGNITRNSFRGPGYNNTDFILEKSTKLATENGPELQLRFEFYNFLNKTNFGAPSGNMSSASFGRITSAKSPRVVQLGAKIVF